MNISLIIVTLDVTKLSGWLKPFAFCRVKSGPCDVGLRGAAREAGRMVGEAAAAHVACKGRLDWSLCGRRTRERSAP